MNGADGAIHEVPEFTGGVNGDEASRHEVAPEFAGSVNGADGSIHEVPEFTGGVNGDEASRHDVAPEFAGSVNGVDGSIHEVPEFTGGVNGDEALIHGEKPEFTGGVNGSEGAVHEILEYKNEQPIVARAVSQGNTYQAPAIRQYNLPETGMNETATLAALGAVGALLGFAALGKKKDDE